MRRLVVPVLTAVAASIATAQAPPAPPPTAQITRTDLIKRQLPPGAFRNVEAVIVDLAPGAAAVRHRHDVAVLVYVLEGTVENQFDGGPLATHKVGESWWESPGTVHDVARNLSPSGHARLLIVYIGEDGKAPTTRLTPP